MSINSLIRKTPNFFYKLKSADTCCNLIWCLQFNAISSIANSQNKCTQNKLKPLRGKCIKFNSNNSYVSSRHKKLNLLHASKLCKKSHLNSSLHSIFIKKR